MIETKQIVYQSLTHKSMKNSNYLLNDPNFLQEIVLDLCSDDFILLNIDCHRHILPESAGVIVLSCFRVSERLQHWITTEDLKVQKFTI